MKKDSRLKNVVKVVEDDRWGNARLKISTLRRIKEWGIMGESYDKVTNKILDIAEKRNGKNNSSHGE